MEIVMRNKWHEQEDVVHSEDELYREYMVYEVDGKNQQAYMTAVIKGNENDWFATAYNDDCNCYYNLETEEVSYEIPEDVLNILVDMACEQIESDYCKYYSKQNEVDYTDI